MNSSFGPRVLVEFFSTYATCGPTLRSVAKEGDKKKTRGRLWKVVEGCYPVNPNQPHQALLEARHA